MRTSGGKRRIDAGGAREMDTRGKQRERERKGDDGPGGNAEPVCDSHARVSGHLFAGV